MPAPSDYAPGQRVHLIAGPMGTVLWDTPHRFTPIIVEAGATGTIETGPGAMPDGWVLVKLDEAAPDGAALYCPVHPVALAPEEA